MCPVRSSETKQSLVLLLFSESDWKGPTSSFRAHSGRLQHRRRAPEIPTRASLLIIPEFKALPPLNLLPARPSQIVPKERNDPDIILPLGQTRVPLIFLLFSATPTYDRAETDFREPVGYPHYPSAATTSAKGCLSPRIGPLVGRS